jgi:hypothetical protein
LTTGYITGTRVTETDTFLNSSICFAPGGDGGFGLRVVSDSTGAPVSGETVNAVMTDVCIPPRASAETEVVYIEIFSVGQGGWLTPDTQGQVWNVGDLNFTVSYQGHAYNFVSKEAFPPVGSNCVTLHVPSGNVTETSAAGDCSQG